MCSITVALVSIILSFVSKKKNFELGKKKKKHSNNNKNKNKNKRLYSFIIDGSALTSKAQDPVSLSIGPCYTSHSKIRGLIRLVSSRI